MSEYLITDYGVKPNSEKLQTGELQAVLDKCKNGGTVIVPEGEYVISSVRMWSGTTLYLKKGAKLTASKNCNDYELYDIPGNVTLYTDQQVLGGDYKYYRRAMISAYGEENISIIGEGGSVIDGVDCFDPDGEEGFRGPHGIFLSNCKNILLKGYTIRNTGNFMHQTDACENLTMEDITVLGGHDGIHLHKGKNFLIKNCKFITGDDCIAGVCVDGVTVTGCELNTSCNIFRIGGKNILIEDCKADGPGYYPHRLSLKELGDLNADRTLGRHNSLVFVEYFASPVLKGSGVADITVRNCKIDGVDMLLHYVKDCRQFLHFGMNLGSVTFENVEATNLLKPSPVHGDDELQPEISLKNTKMTFRNPETEAFDSECVRFTEL